MKKVQILLSSYNGEKYIREQIDSILKQDYPNISLLIRDDGSTDKTVDIIKEYVANDPRISFYQGENVGVRESFFDLMRNADTSMDYYALSDQDDVWKPHKISRAIMLLGDCDKQPALYCGRTELVTQELIPIKSTIKKAPIRPHFGNALVENIATGCTCVFSRSLMELVVNHIPEFTVMHDWWLYLSASAFGKVVFDEEACVLYRQHEHNMIGTKATYYEEFRNRLRNYKSNRGQIRKQLNEFQRLYEVDIPDRELLKLVLDAKRHFFCRWRIVVGKAVYRQRFVDNIIFKLLFLFGKI